MCDQDKPLELFMGDDVDSWARLAEYKLDFLDDDASYYGNMAVYQQDKAKDIFYLRDSGPERE